MILETRTKWHCWKNLWNQGFPTNSFSAKWVRMSCADANVTKRRSANQWIVSGFFYLTGRGCGAQLGPGCLWSEERSRNPGNQWGSSLDKNENSQIKTKSKSSGSQSNQTVKFHCFTTMFLSPKKIINFDDDGILVTNSPCYANHFILKITPI